MLSDFLSRQKRLIGVRANLVIDRDSNFVGQDGTSRFLSNEVDRQLLIQLRQLADLIVTDASTARAERYKASKHAPIEVWSRSGNFAGISEGLTFRITDNPNDQIRNFDGQAILLETGPTLTAILGHGMAVDELKLTVTGAKNQSDAREAAQKAISHLNLGYLSKSEQEYLKPCWFFSFSR